MTNNEPIKYKICGLDRVVDERGSAFISVRKIAWGVDQDEDVEDESKIKLDIRKYYSTDEGERMSKGVSMLTEDGCHELVHVLLEEGYGNTATCLNILTGRNDFKEAVEFMTDEENSESTEFYDPRELLKLAE